MDIVEESFYVVVLIQDLDYYAHLIAGITSDFTRNSARIQVLFQRFENTLRALTWLEARKKEIRISESASPTLLIVIDPVREVLSTMGTSQKGKSGNPDINIINRVFKGYSEVAYFHGGAETYASRLGAHLVSKSDVGRGVIQICKILSNRIERRSHGGFQGEEIYTMLLKRGIPIPPHLQPQQPQAHLQQFPSSGFGGGDASSAELYELKTQLLLIQERGKNAIADLEDLTRDMKVEQREVEGRLTSLGQEIADLKSQLFGGSMDTNEKSMIGQLMAVNQRLTYAQNQLKDYAGRIVTLEAGFAKVKGAMGAIAGDDDKGLATQVLSGLFALAKQKEYAFFLIVLAFILILSVGFNVSIADMADFVLKWKGD